MLLTSAFDLSFSVTLNFYSCAALPIFLATNLSSRQCTQRREVIAAELEHLLRNHESPDAFVQQSLLLECLGLNNDKKSILTRTINAIFPNSSKKTVTIENKATYPLYNYTSLQ